MVEFQKKTKKYQKSKMNASTNIIFFFLFLLSLSLYGELG